MAAKIGVKFVSKKISKIRWQPETFQNETDIFATGSWDNNVNKIEVWSIPKLSHTEEAIEPEQLCGCDHIGDVTELKFVGANRLLASSSTGSVSMYHLQTRSNTLAVDQSWEKLHTLSGKGCTCTSVVVNGSDIITTGEDGSIKVLRMGQQKPVRSMDGADSCCINAAVQVKNHEIVTTNSRGQLKQWDLRQPDNKPVSIFLLTGEQTGLVSVDRHPSQAHVVAAGGEDGFLNIWDLRQQKYPATLFTAHDGPVWDVCFHQPSPDHLFTCSNDGSLLHWDNSSASLHSTSILASHGIPDHPPQTERASVSCSWLSGEIGQPDVQTDSLLPPSTMSINSLDILGQNIVCGTDGESVYFLYGINTR
ncbi:nucleoporin Nup43-like [Anneissia japonica]|uniref:nucleoporin Nup43-like n=1 Tax=Anneissia japonica TaxID=1529436 RepID=UPI0014256F55|nr:nucleoporin Nup43-like [Anneissia japonica]